MSLSQQRRDAYTQTPIEMKLSKVELNYYEAQCVEYYSTEEGLTETIDTDLSHSDIVLGKVK